MPIRGKISEFIDFEALAVEKQKAADIIAEFIAQVNKGANIKIQLSTAEKASEIAKGFDVLTDSAKKSAEAGQKVADTQRKVSDAVRDAGKTLQDLSSQIKTTNGSFDDLARLQVALKASTAALTTAKKDLAKAFKDGAISEEEYLDALTQITKQETVNKLNQLDLSRAIRNTAKEIESESGSLDELRSKLNLATLAFDKISEAERKGETGTELTATIKTLNSEITELEQTTGRFGRNVGNYQGSLAKPFELLRQELARLKEVAKNDPTTTTVGDSGSNSVSQTQTAIIQLTNILDTAGKAGQTTTSSVKALEKGFLSLADSGNFSEQFLKEFLKETGSAKDAMADLRDELKLAASDTKGIDQVVSSLNVLTGIAQGVTGAFALFGDQSEDTQKTIQKLVAVQGLANSVQQVGQELTKKGTLANKAYEFSQRQLSIAMDTTASAGARLRAVLITTGIGALIIGSGLLIANFSKIKDALTGATTATKAYTETLEAYKTGAQGAIEQTQKVNTAFEQARDGVISKKDALKIYNDTLGDTFGKAKTLEEAEDKYNAKAGVYIEIMGLKAQANALFAKSAEITAKAVIAGNEDQLGFFDKLKIAIRAQVSGAGDAVKTAVDLQEAAVAQVKADAKADADDIDKIAKAAAAKAIKLAQDNKININPTTSAAKQKDLNDKAAQDTLKSEYDLQKARLEASQRFDKAIIDGTKSTFNEKLNALKNYNDIAIASIETEEKFQLASEKIKLNVALQNLERQKKEKGANISSINKEEADLTKSFNAKISDINTKASADKVILTRETGLTIQSLYDKEFENSKKKQQEDFAIFKKLQEEKNQLVNDQIDLQTNKSVLQTNADFQVKLDEATGEKRTKIEKDLQDKIGDIIKEGEFAKSVIREDSLKGQLALLQAYGFAGTSIQKKITDEELIQSKLRDEINAKEIADKIAREELYAEKKKEILSASQELFTAFVNGRIDEEKNALESLSQAQDKKAQRDIEIVNQSVLSEQDKAAKISIINARSQAQKDQIDRKQKELDYKKAQFDRLITIASIISNTAIAVSKAVASFPLTGGMPFSGLAIALGAIQVATVLARPIPRYKDGTKDAKHPGGLALVGDGFKKEMTVGPDGSVGITPAYPTIVDLKKGTTVFPDAEKMMHAMMVHHMQQTLAATGKTDIVGQAFPVEHFDKTMKAGFVSIVNAVKNQPRITLKGKTGYDVMFGHGDSEIKYLNNNLQGK